MSVKVNGIHLDGLLEVTQGFSPHGGADMAPVFQSREDGGSDFVRTVRNKKTLPMPFIIKGDTEMTQTEKYDMIQKILHTKELVKLELGIFPNEYMMAIPSGDLQYSEGVFQGTGTITWEIPDGLRHKIDRRKFDFKLNADGILEAELENTGTEDAIVDYEIKMNHENGYIGIVSEHGIIQLGKINEADSVTDYRQVILSRNTTDYSNWTKASVFYENLQKDVSGTMSATSDFGGWMGALSGLNAGTTKSCYGAANELVFETPVTNLYLWARLWFETGIMGQTGLTTLAFVAEDNTIIGSMDVIKTDTVGNRANVIFSTPEGQKKNIPFTPSFWIKDNPYGTEGRLTNRNMFDMMLENGNLRFFWYGGYHTFPVPTAQRNKKIKRIQYFQGQFKGRNSGKQMITRMGIRDIIVADMKNAYQRDIANRFEDKSIITINGAERKSRYNGMIRLGDEIKVPTYFKIPPGKTKVNINFSSFSIPAPTASAFVNEVRT